MKAPVHISIRDYSYTLPEDRIAGYPLPERDASRLLVYRKGELKDDHYHRLAAYIPENSLLVFNNTKVVEARLLFQKTTGGVIEIFCLEPHEQYPDISSALQQRGKVWWQCLVGGASKWKAGQLLEKTIHAGSHSIKLTGRFIEKRADCFIIELSWTPDTLTMAELLHASGAIPLPPYIKRNAESLDSERYQTIYAREEGSVAAPTAGLHFTDRVFAALQAKHIRIAEVTLHVGAGTFKPVQAEHIGEHLMHAEWIDVSRDMIEELIHPPHPVIAVGTTSLRTLESLYWLGVKSRELGVRSSESVVRSRESGVGGPESLVLAQWEAYELADKNIPVKDALEALLKWMEFHKLDRLITKTQILIAPGYECKIVDGLITNFHQPQSTLLLLVAALIGNDWKKVYDHALQQGYRFLSYGDGCLLWRMKNKELSQQ